MMRSASRWGLAAIRSATIFPLTNLVPELMQMVDDGKIALSPAYQIAALKPEEQQMLVTTIDYEQATPSLSQAQRMKKFSQAGRAQ